MPIASAKATTERKGVVARDGERLDGPQHGVSNDLAYTQPSLAIAPTNSAIVGIPRSLAAIDNELSSTYYNAAAGAPLIVSDGQVIKPDGTYPCPGNMCRASSQSAAGLNHDGELVPMMARTKAAGVAGHLIDDCPVHTALKRDDGGSARP